MNQHYAALEFYAIIDKLKEHALSQRAKDKLDGLTPYLSEDICVRKMAETTAARGLLDQLGSPPLSLMTGLDEAVALAEAGGMLIPEQLGDVARFAESCKRMAAWLKRGEASGEELALYGRSIENLSPLRSEIERCVAGEALCDDASPALRHIRRKAEHVEAQIKEKLSHILQSRKQYLSDGYITMRQGRYVLPVQRKYQGQFGGTVIEASGKGSTVFMEPSAIAKLSQDMGALALEEDAEVRRILYTLAALVAESAGAIRRNMEAMEVLDVLFAKAKLSAAMKAVPVAIGGERRLDIRKGRHPLLDEESCVPLDCRMEEGTSGIIITGPNTGGKTVAIKTVGLMSLMAQCGLHIPCAEGSYIAMRDGYWCDIGDSQDISQNLSTFSGHMTNVIHILEHAGRDSLVLLDELGSGTDPAEGMGIAVAILEELRRRGGMFLVTTHYPQVKAYASNTDGVMSARMAFDRDSLRPLYRLEMGKTGESCALSIARHLGLAPQLLARAHYEVYGEYPGGAPDAAAMRVPASRLIRRAPVRETVDLSTKFTMGDSVIVLPDGETAIVYRPADEQGDVVVQVKGEKRKVKHNRLKLQVPASELYPPDYDFSIIFDTVSNRKARHQMGKRHDPSQIIVYEDGET
ncbi:MAG: DNA mismatch repair protein MutS [Christensenellaceae bacterium]|nr:DNA mismatch repair protein MutS [Christensenellaceae bacterium]MEA5068153.1 DNA mismatch repair protein MutS [Christensenellaceae bacterium]